MATKYNLYQYVRFSSEVKAAKWDAATQKWRVSVHVLAGKEAESCENYMIETNFLVSGVGQLNQPYWPDIPGRLNFKGKVMHSARWDWSYDMRDKRVAIIGNGESSTG